LHFAKNEQDNIGLVELEDFRDLARKWFSATESAIDKAIEIGEIEEIWDDENESPKPYGGRNPRNG
jgi:hypothetical protein